MRRRPAQLRLRCRDDIVRRVQQRGHVGLLGRAFKVPWPSAESDSPSARTHRSLTSSSEPPSLQPSTSGLSTAEWKVCTMSPNTRPPSPRSEHPQREGEKKLGTLRQATAQTVVQTLPSSILCRGSESALTSPFASESTSALFTARRSRANPYDYNGHRNSRS